jgi:NADH-quinone oxidoreductase subunit A
MLESYIPIVIMLVTALGVVAGLLAVSWFVGTKRPSRTKLSPYECGVPPVGSARDRFSVKFYMTAMIFIVFDIETVFFYPWAVTFGRLGLFGFIEMAIFVGILFIAYFYLWRRGAFDWD